MIVCQLDSQLNEEWTGIWRQKDKKGHINVLSEFTWSHCGRGARRTRELQHFSLPSDCVSVDSCPSSLHPIPQNILLIKNDIVNLQQKTCLKKIPAGFQSDRPAQRGFGQKLVELVVGSSLLDYLRNEFMDFCSHIQGEYMGVSLLFLLSLSKFS